MNRGKRATAAVYDEWAGYNINADKNGWYLSTAMPSYKADKADKGEIVNADTLSTTRDRVSDLEAQLQELQELKNKKKRKLKIKIKM